MLPIASRASIGLLLGVLLAAGGFWFFGNEMPLLWGALLRPIGSDYYTDGAKVYYDRRFCDSARSCTPPPPEEISGADAATFRVRAKGLGSSWATDKDRVYRGGEPVPYLDAGSFSIIGRGRYVRDKRGVYFENGDEPLPGADPATFEELSGYNSFAKDRAHIYERGTLRSDLDAATFACLTGDWCRDKNEAYYDGVAIEGADPATFDTIPYGAGAAASVRYARDARSVYCGTKKIPEADPETFRVVPGTGNGMTQTWEDERYAYDCENRALKNAP